ncbi:MAG: chloride channel protein [Gemmatimonadota bacterium]
MTGPGRTRFRWRARGRRWWRAFTGYVLEHDIEEGWLIILFAAVIGAGAGFAIVAFYALVDGVAALSDRLGALLGFGPGSIGPAFIVVPAGLLLAKWLRARVPGDASGEMVPSLMLSAAKSEGELPVRAMATKLVSAGVTIGSGGSLGAEGPGAAAGAAIGSGLGQLFRFGPNRMKVLLACGAAGGISAAFNAPIAGVLFALEIVLGTFAVAVMSPVVVASVMGAVVARSWVGIHPLDVPPGLVFVSARELGFYALLGLACGLLAVVFVRAFYATQDLMRRTLRTGPLAPIVAGLLIASAAIVSPELLGPGRHGIQLVLAAELAGFTALAISLLKILTSGITMGGGGAGGVFTPSLFIGAAFGSFFGLTVQRLFPGLTITPEAYALVGMASLLAGATFAPLTAIMMVFELTDDYELILPLMLACVISYLLARRVNRESIYTETLARAGEHIRHGADRSILETVRVADCYDRDPHVVAEDAPLGAILNRLRGSRQTDFPVVSPELELVGMLSYRDLSHALGDADLHELVIAADLVVPDVETVCPEDTLLEAMRRMGMRDLDHIPVVDSRDGRRLLGLLSRGAIMEAYQTRLRLQD